MSAYVIVDIEDKNPDVYVDFKQLAPARKLRHQSASTNLVVVERM